MGRHRTPQTIPAAQERHLRSNRGTAGRTSFRPRAARLAPVVLGCALAMAVVPASNPAPVAGTATAIDGPSAASWKSWVNPADTETERESERIGRASRRPASTETTSAGTSPTPTSEQPTASPTAAPARTTGSGSSAAATSASSQAGLLASGRGAVSGLVAGAADLASRPTSGPAWNALLAAANDHSGSVDLTDQESTHAARTLGSALVYARTGHAGQRDHVVSVLRQLPTSSLSGARVLSVGRQLAGYVIAADLVGYRDAAFTAWAGSMRTKDIGGHGRWTTLSGTSENSASNWGAWAMSSRIAISAYLGDTADLQRAATVFRGFTGERAAYAGFEETSDFDPSWACGDAWVPINPSSCGARGGAIVEDISRSGGSYPSVDSTGLTYSWEVLGGATLSARLLERAGFRDVWSWGDRALLRAATFLRAHGGYAPDYRVNQYIPHEINAAYRTNLGPVGAAGYGRQFGFSDWLS